MIKAYLAGPMRGYDKWNFPAFDRNAAFLRRQGWGVISPADLDRAIGFDENDESVVFTEADFEQAMRRDYMAILESNAIAFIPGWEKSSGAALERSFAGKLKLPMYRVDADAEYLERERIVGICGFARSGKDTLANQLVGNLGFERRGFADALKGILYALNPWVGAHRVADIVDALGWEEAKENREIRGLLQRLGTEGGRAHLGDSVWVDGLFSRPHSARLVIPDVRFPNEARAIQDRGGIVIRVMRPGYEPVNSHTSETAFSDGEDYVIVNDGTELDLYWKCAEILT